MNQLQAHGPGGNGGNPEPIFTLNNEVKVELHSLLSHYQTWIFGIGDLALGVASTSLSSANMSAPLFGVLKIEPDKAPKGFLQRSLLQRHQIKKQWARSGSPVIRSRGIAVELELAGKIKGSVQQLVCCVRAETGNLKADWTVSTLTKEKLHLPAIFLFVQLVLLVCVHRRVDAHVWARIFPENNNVWVWTLQMIQ